MNQLKINNIEAFLVKILLKLESFNKRLSKLEYK